MFLCETGYLMRKKCLTSPDVMEYIGSLIVAQHVRLKSGSWRKGKIKWIADVSQKGKLLVKEKKVI